MNDELIKIEGEIENIRVRNLKVEAGKAWETSGFRIGSIMIITYCVAVAILVSIGNDYPFRNALVPMLGFFLSTQSLPFLKRRWIAKYLEKRNS